MADLIESPEEMPVVPVALEVVMAIYKDLCMEVSTTAIYVCPQLLFG
jgi:hypothetical protein